MVLDSDDLDDLNPKTCLQGRRYAIRTLGQKRSRPQSTFAFVKTTKPGDVLGPGTGQHTSSRLRQVLDCAWLVTRGWLRGGRGKGSLGDVDENCERVWIVHRHFGEHATIHFHIRGL